MPNRNRYRLVIQRLTLFHGQIAGKHVAENTENIFDRTVLVRGGLRMYKNIAQAGHFAAGEPAHADGGCAVAARIGKRAQNIGAVAAHGHGKNHVPRLKMHLKMMQKNIFITAIVGKRRNGADIVGKGERSKSGTPFQVCPRDQVINQVRRQRGAAAVANDVYGLVVGPRRFEGLDYTLRSDSERVTEWV